MPYRQVISGRVRIPMVSDLVIPFRAVTSVRRLRDQHRPADRVRRCRSAADHPDSLKARREARRDSLRASADDGTRRTACAPGTTRTAGRAGATSCIGPANAYLDRYRGWTDSLTLEGDPAELARAREVGIGSGAPGESLPDSVTGLRWHGFGYERLTDAFRYDRVQGISFGLGYRVRVPGLAFTNLHGTVRYGFSDERVTGRLCPHPGRPGGAPHGQRISGRGERGSVRARARVRQLVQRAVRRPRRWGLGPDARRVGAVRDLAGHRARARPGARGTSGRPASPRPPNPAVNDFLGGNGVFPPNAPVDEGHFGGGFVRLSGVGDLRWHATADVLGGEGTTTGRVFGDLRYGIGGSQRGDASASSRGSRRHPRCGSPSSGWAGSARCGGTGTASGEARRSGPPRSMWRR